jgi:hypothetical protein
MIHIQPSVSQFIFMAPAMQPDWIGSEPTIGQYRPGVGGRDLQG